MIPETQSLVNLYPKSPLFADLSSEARRRLLALSTPRHCEPGEILIREGAVDPYMYVIKRGRVRIEKNTSDGADSHAIVELGSGETFGEMKLVAPAPSSATVIAIEPLDVFFVDLERLRSEPDTTGLREQILTNIARILSARLRSTSTQAVDAMQAEIAQGRLRESAGRFIVYVFAIMSGFGFFLAGLGELGAYRPPQMLLSAFVIFGSAIPMGILMRRGGFRPADYGLTLRGWPRVLRDAVLCTLPVLALLTLLKLGWKLSSPARNTVPLFNPAAIFEGEFHFFKWMAGLFAYSILSLLQELFARSGLQGSIQLFIPRADGKTHWQAILIANLIFASAHAYLGLRFVLASFIPGLFWGWLFARQRSLIGVAVSHSLIGLWALFVLGLQVLVGGR